MLGLKPRRLMAFAAAMPLAVVALPAQASAADPGRGSACEGVRILTQPLIVTGTAIPARGGLLPDLDLPALIDEVTGQITEVVAPPEGVIECQPVPEPVSARGRRCKNAQESGARLQRRLAAKAVRCLINGERNRAGLGDLAPRKPLKRAAKRHSKRMVVSNCFAHQCSGELDIVGRVTTTGYLPCRCSWSVGEDIAWGARRFSTPASIVAAWMASPPHRAVILSGGLKDVDVGVQPGRPGNRGALAATYTADFGRKG